MSCASRVWWLRPPLPRRVRAIVSCAAPGVAREVRAEKPLPILPGLSHRPAGRANCEASRGRTIASQSCRREVRRSMGNTLRARLRPLQRHERALEPVAKWAALVVLKPALMPMCRPEIRPLPRSASAGSPTRTSPSRGSRRGFPYPTARPVSVAPDRLRSSPPGRASA